MPEDSYTYSVPVRYQDIDHMSHVNHAVYARYLEEARLAYLRDVIGESFEDTDTVIAHLELDYERRVAYGDDVVVSLAIADVGTASVTVDYEVHTDDGRPRPRRPSRSSSIPRTGRRQPFLRRGVIGSKPTASGRCPSKSSAVPGRYPPEKSRWAANRSYKEFSRFAPDPVP